MAENSPFFDEHLSLPSDSEYVELFGDDSSWETFNNNAGDIERRVARFDPSSLADLEIIHLYNVELQIQLNADYIGQQSRILALAYEATNGEVDSAETVILDSDQLVYRGVRLRHIHSQWRAMLQFDVNDIDTTSSSKTYYVPPNKHHIMSLELMRPTSVLEIDEANEDDSIGYFFQKDFRIVSASTADRYFCRASPEEQRNVLADILDHITGYFPREYRDHDVAIECKKFYTAYDSVENQNLQESFTDMAKESSGLNRTLIGHIQGFDFPEVHTLPTDQPLHYGDLNMNDGSYCLVLRNDREGKTYYILPQTITDID